MISGCVFNIQRYSLHDGGGIRTMVFLKGCPFHCPWCSNPESLAIEPELMFRKSLCINCHRQDDGTCEVDAEDCPTGAKEILGKMMSVDEVFDIVKRDQIFYETSGGGVTISGGECLLQQDFVIALLQKCKEENIHTAIETTLALPISRLEELVNATDLFLVDLKIMNQERSQKITGISIDVLKNNIELIQNLGGNIIARVPLIPTFTTADINFQEIIQYLKKIQLKEVHLLPFHKLGESKYEGLSKDYNLHDLSTLSNEAVSEIEKLFTTNGFKAIIGGT